MTKIAARGNSYGPPEQGRVFADEAGRFWTAAFTGEAIVFTCVSDGRLPGRAIAQTPGDTAAGVSDDELRAWLDSAPHIGRLT